MLTQEYLQSLMEPGARVVRFHSLASYDQNMHVLYHELRQWLDDRFQGGEVRFEPGERLVFEHDDVDFFPDESGFPFTLYNLQLMLRELDISNCFVRIITNLPDYQIYCDRVAKRLVNDVPIQAISGSLMGTCLTPPRPWTEYQDYEADLSEIRPDADHITWPFVAQTRLKRFHRTYFMSRLHSRGLHQSGWISHSNQLMSGNVAVPRQDVEPSPCHFLTTSPFTRGSPEMVIRDPGHQASVRYFLTLPNYFWPEQQPDPPEAIWASAYTSTPEMRNGLLYVGLETSANMPRPFVTRVTLRPIVNFRPFVIVGSPGILQFMRDLGFQTFDGFWDESYDQEPDFERRIEAVIDVIEGLCRYDAAALKRLYQDMWPRIEHNHRHFFQGFRKQQQDLLRAGLS